MTFLTDFVTMLVVVNPFSKMLASSIMTKRFKSKEDVKKIINLSNMVALLALLIFALFGPYIFKNLIGISDSALIIACGLSLGIFGANYLFRNDLLTIDDDKKNVMYLSIGLPFIAGPASITAITLISSYSTILYSTLIVGLAILINYILMIIAFNFMPIRAENEKLQYLTGKITGLFMLAMGIQFVLNGFSNWFNF